LVRKKVSGSVQVPGGLELPPQNTEKSAISENGGAESGAFSVESSSLEPNLQQIIDAWPTLPEAFRGAIMAMIAAARTDG